MTAKPFFSGRIPQSLYDALEEYQRQTNESKTEILIKALSTYVNHPVEPPVSSQTGAVEASRIDALEKKFETLEQELLVLRGLFTTNSSNSVLEQTSEPVSKVEEKRADQISLILTEEVIKDDNNNKSDNNTDNISDNTDLDSSSIDINADNQGDNKKEDLIHKTFIGTMKTVEVVELPGLQGKDLKKIKSKIHNAKKSKNQTAQIDPYTIIFSKRPPVEGKQREELFWDVYEDKSQLVIDSDNRDDN